MARDNPFLFSRPWLRNYDPHVPAEIQFPLTNLFVLFQTTAVKYPNETFLSINNFDFSFGLIYELVENMAKNLINKGLKKGERVALILPNIPQFVISYYAVLRAGGIVVAMNPNYKLNEYEFLFKDSNPKYVICLDRHREIIISLEKKSESFLVIETSIKDIPNLFNAAIQETINKKQDPKTLLDFIRPVFSIPDFPIIRPDDAAIFQYSGGTTGVPKAAIGMHCNLIANVHQFQIWCDLKPGKETILAVVPLYHVYGMVLALALSATIGAKLILVDDPKNIDLILEEIEKQKVTFFPGVPTMYYAINQNNKVKEGKCDLSSIKACISGSATLHPQIKEEFERLTGGKLVEGYGLSEAPTATHCNPLCGKNKTGSIGLPLPGVVCRVVDLENGLVDKNLGETGELILQGPQVMKGYHNNPAENKEALRDEWLFTGDVVRMDEDGYFFIVDRKKSLIKVGGFQVWPNEIEGVLDSHPLILESAVGGIPDIEKGEKVIAWVVLKSGEFLGKQEIIQWCENQLIFYKLPVEIIFVNKIPRTGMGKVLRRELIADYDKKDPII